MTSFVQTLIDKWEGNAPALKEEYRTKLQHGVWVVEFTKTDGTPATMECTLDERFMPPQPISENTRPEKDHLIHVYSTDRQGWRSFVVANVKAFYKKPEIL